MGVEMTEYYEFEHKVLELIQKELRVISFSFDKDTTEAKQTQRAEDGHLYEVVVTKFVTDEYIVLNFTNDFHYKFDLNMIVDAYNQKQTPSEFVNRLTIDVCEDFIRNYIKKDLSIII